MGQLFSNGPQRGLAALFIAVCLAVSVWDLVALANGRREDTVSEILAGWVREFPILAVAIGVVIGHLFWPR